MISLHSLSCPFFLPPLPLWSVFVSGHNVPCTGGSESSTDLKLIPAWPEQIGNPEELHDGFIIQTAGEDCGCMKHIRQNLFYLYFVEVCLLLLSSHWEGYILNFRRPFSHYLIVAVVGAACVVIQDAKTGTRRFCFKSSFGNGDFTG